jgi:hypothetical protein
LSSVVLSGDTSGSITIQAPSVAGTNTLTLPASTGTVLTSASNTNFPAGSVLQVVNATYSTAVTNNTNTYADTGLTATITPKSATSKILIIINHADIYKATSDTSARIQLLRNSTSLLVFSAYASGTGNTSIVVTATGTNYLDSPATTSSITYKTQFLSNSGAGVTLQFGNSTSTITLMEIAG